MKNKFINFWIAFSVSLLFISTVAQSGETTRVSVSSKGEQQEGWDYNDANSVISADGRFVAFPSLAENLVLGDTNEGPDAFVHDRLTGKTRRVSVSSAGVQGNFSSFPTAISADGRYVAFSSLANNLVPGDTNDATDAFIHDLVTGKTTRVGFNLAKIESNGYTAGDSPIAISADGRFVAFSSYSPGTTSNAFVHDRATGNTSLVNAGELLNTNGCFVSSISPDGRFVVYHGDPTLPGEPYAPRSVYVYDRMTSKTRLASVSSEGIKGDGYSYGGAISANGRYVVFSSNAGNLVAGEVNPLYLDKTYVHDLVTGKTTRVAAFGSGISSLYNSYPAVISADARYIATFSLGTYSRCHVILDRVTGRSECIDSSAQEGDWVYIYLGGMSADGRYVSFSSEADNLTAGDTNEVTDIFVRDRLLDKRHSADLQVTVAAKPASVTKGETASYKLKVTNKGPDKADHVSLINIISNGTVIGIKPDQGSCAKAAVSVCRLGILPNGKSATVTFDIRANAKSLTQQVSVNAAPKDNVPGNNARKFSTRVKHSRHPSSG